MTIHLIHRPSARARRSRLLGSATFLLLLLGACSLPFGQDDPPPAPVTPVAPSSHAEPGAPTAASEPAAQPTPTTTPQELRSNKIADFVEACTNRFSRRAIDSRDRYLSWVDPETGPTGRERRIGRGVFTLYDPTRCRQATNALSERAPPMPELEAAAERFTAAIETLVPVLRQADTYYERESYRDDDAARGRELHPQLMSGFRAFDEANEALGPMLRRIEDEARAARLERLAQDPAHRTAYLVERTVDEGRRIMDVVTAMEVEDRRLVTEDPGAFVTQVQTFQTHVDELRGHQPTPPDRAPQGYSGFKGSANEMVTSALGLMRRVRDETPFSRSELGRLGTAGGWMTDGSPDELIREYNELIREYNQLRFR